LEEFGSLVGARLKFLRKSRPLRLFYEKMLIISSFSSNVDPHFNNLVDNLRREEVSCPAPGWTGLAAGDAALMLHPGSFRSFNPRSSIYTIPIKQGRKQPILQV